MIQDWHELLSRPEYGTRTEKDIFVTMRDGVRLAADVYRPDGDGKFPALLSVSPYSKDVQKLPVREYPTDRDLGNGGIECGDTDYFVSRGYVHVIADARGTGVSEGGYRVFSEKEQQDGYDLIEWIAAQPWCNGNVGMLGSSYFAMIQLLVAAQQPPHLKAICPVDSATDFYRHWGYHGGMLNVSFVSTWWDGSLVVNNVGPSDLEAAQTESIRENLMNDPEIRAYPRLWKAARWPETNPHLFDILAHPLNGPWYKERSASEKFDRIRVPTCLIGRWTSAYIHLPGSFSAFAHIQAPKKLMITTPESGVGFNRPWHENHDIVLRWYDHWLKGNDTGVMKEAPIHLYIEGRNEYRHENEWPLARTQWTKYHLGLQGGLKTGQPGWNEKPDRFTSNSLLMPGEKVPALRYATAPLAQDLEITGPIALELHAAIDGPDTNWIVELTEVGTTGAETRVSIGWLRASHREIDAEQSKPWQPVHPHTRSDPVEPGKVIRYSIEIREISHVFRAGNRMQLVVKAQDAPWEGTSYIYKISYHVPPIRDTRHTIYHTPEHPSHLLLPVIPA